MRVATIDEVRKCAREAVSLESYSTAESEYGVTFSDPDPDTCGLVLATLRSRGDRWILSRDPRLAQLFWTTSFRADFISGLRPGCILSRLPWSSLFGRKDEFSAILKEERFPFFPESFAIPREMHKLRSALGEGNRLGADGTSLWVMKPARGGGGRKIKFLPSFEVLEAASSSKRPMVIQRYIPHISLINGCKFHLRVFVLILDRWDDPSKNVHQVLVYREGLVMIATEPFDASSTSQFVHVTNNRVQYADHRGPSPPNWSIQGQFKQYVNKQRGHLHFDKLWSHVKSVLATSIRAVANKWSSMVSASSQPLHCKCFQLIGADICIAKDFTEAWVLELNTVPALWANLDPTKDSAQEFAISASVVCDLLRIVLTPRNDSPVLGGFEKAGSAANCPVQTPRPTFPTMAVKFVWSCLGHCVPSSDYRPLTQVQGSRTATHFGIASSYAEMLAENVVDVLLSHFASHGEPIRILHIGSERPHLVDQLQRLPRLAELTHWTPASSGSCTLQGSFGMGCEERFPCVVDDSLLDRQSSSISSRLLRQRCFEVADLLCPEVDVKCADAPHVPTTGLYIVFSWTNEAQLICETFDLVKSTRLHLDCKTAWLHIACSRAPSVMNAEPVQRPRCVLVLPQWASGPAVELSLMELSAKLQDPDGRYKWIPIEPPYRCGDQKKFDSVASEAGLLCVRGVAGKRTARSKGLMFLDVSGSSELHCANVQIKFDAEWLLPDMMLLISRIASGSCLKIEGIIIRRLRGGNRASLLALRIWQISL